MANPNEVTKKARELLLTKSVHEVAILLFAETNYKNIRSFRHKLTLWKKKMALPLSVEEEKEYKEIRGADGSVQITDSVKAKLSDDDLFARYNRSPNEWRISNIYYKEKSRKNGDEYLLLTVLFTQKKKEIVERNFRDMMIESLSTLAPVVPLRPVNKPSGQLLEIDIFDAHFGKLSWAEETGDNYDLQITAERYLAAMSNLLHRGSRDGVDRILFPIGNDLMHTDNTYKTTTAGTPQDVDGRWQKMYMTAKKAVMDAINMASQVAPVDIVVVPSNHDFYTVFMLGDLLATYYQNDKNITVNNSPKSRKYYQWGKCGIMFTHGNEENVKELPRLMLTETRSIWDREVCFMEAHIGHWHKKKQLQFVSGDDTGGVTIRFLRSISATDAWHYRKGYTGAIQGSEAFIWDKEYGMLNNILEPIRPVLSSK